MSAHLAADVTRRQWREALAVPAIAAIGLGAIPFLFRIGVQDDFGDLVAMHIAAIWPHGLFIASCAIWLAFRVIELRFPERLHRESRLALIPLALTALGVDAGPWAASALVTTGAFAIRGVTGADSPRASSVAVHAVAIVGALLISACAGVLSGEALAGAATAATFAAAWTLRLPARDMASACVVMVVVIMLSAFIPSGGVRPGATQAIVAAAVAALGLLVVGARSSRTGVVFQTAMLVIAIGGVVAIDRTIAGAGRVKDDPSRPAEMMTNRENLFGRALAPGEFNDEPWGWWIETGFFRMGAPSPQKRPGTTRILVQGASSTQGFGIERDEDVWTSVLERELNARDASRRFEVVNAGLASTTSFTMLVNYREELGKYEHDVLLLYLGDNDATYSRGPLTEREMFDRMMSSPDSKKGGEASMQIARALNDSPFYRYVRIATARFREAPGLPKGAAARVPAVPLGDFARNLREFLELAQRHGAKLVLVGEASRSDLNAYLDVMKKFAGEQDLDYLDANFAPRACGIGDDGFFLGQAHLSIAANACLGRFLADALVGSRALATSGSP